MLNRRNFLISTAAGAGLLTTGSPVQGQPQRAKRPFPNPKELYPKLEAIRQELLAPGAGVIVRSASLGDWTATFGHQARGSSAPALANNHFRIGSNTKTWTGTVILQLMDENKLKLSDPVSKYHPDVPNGAHITIEQLLTMRSGLYNYSESLELNESLDKNPKRQWTHQELLAMAFKGTPYFAPGQGYHYSNTNTLLLGLIIEQLTGSSLDQEFFKRIFVPLGLSQTSFPAKNSASKFTLPYPRGYQYGTNVGTMASQVLPPDMQAKARAGTLVPVDCTDDNSSWTWSAGEGISTLDNLATYVQALVGGGLLKEATQKMRLASIQPVNPAMPEVGYGWNLARFGSYYGHTGELPGYNSFMGHDPARKISIVTWSSLAAGPDGRAPAVTMARAVIGHLEVHEA